MEECREKRTKTLRIVNRRLFLTLAQIEKKVWVNLGDMFIKMPKDNVEKMIKKGRGEGRELPSQICPCLS